MKLDISELLAVAGFLGIAYVVWDRVTSSSENKSAEATAAAYGGAGYLSLIHI